MSKQLPDPAQQAGPRDAASHALRDAPAGSDTASHAPRSATAGSDAASHAPRSATAGSDAEHAATRSAAAEAAAEFGAAADEVDDAAAARLGVNRTDLRILGLMHAAQSMTAGALAAAARLSPAATTAAIQRLVAAGHLRREVDPADRRRAVVTITATTASTIAAVYGPIAEAGQQLLDHYSPAELALITDFLRVARRLQLEQAERIRTMPTATPSDAGVGSGQPGPP